MPEARVSLYTVDDVLLRRSWRGEVNFDGLGSFEHLDLHHVGGGDRIRGTRDRLFRVFIIVLLRVSFDTV